MENREKTKTFVLIGQPNVGKSALMNYLTGTKAMVSNYPGTTVEILEGDFQLGDDMYHIIDTPGTYTLHSDTDEQRVTQRILMETPIDLIINVVDAANLDRNLYLTLQLLDFEIPMVVVLNQIDRARGLGISIDSEKMSGILKVPVVPISAIRGEGLEELKRVIVESQPTLGRPVRFSDALEHSIEILAKEIKENLHEVKETTAHPVRTLAIHLLEHDKLDEYILKAYPGVDQMVENLQKEMGDESPACPNCFRDCSFCPASGQQHPIFLTCLERTEKARQISRAAVKMEAHRKDTLAERIEGIIDRPLTGFPILLAVLYVSFKLVMLAVDGTGGLITTISELFGRWWGPLVNLPEGPVVNILTKSFSEGIIIPFSTVMPAMISVYAIIALLEDSGLLPRIAVLVDRFTRLISLPGQSLIPLILGFGCRAPAVLSTRILTDKKERFMVITLLAIVVPCAASLGIIAAVVAQFNASAPVIIISMLAVFLAISIILSRFIKGQSLDLILEVPPLRLPVLKNIFSKTWMRLEGFFTQVLPIMLVASIVIRVLLDLGVFKVIQNFSSVTQFLFGIRGEAFVGVVVTIVQRYLAPIVLLNLPLTAREATIASTMVALSFPCLPVSVLTYRELGLKSFLQIMIIAGIVPILIGIILNVILP